MLLSRLFNMALKILPLQEQASGIGRLALGNTGSLQANA
jgi:hypothetical protein